MIGSGGKQVTHTSETNAAHCLLQLNIHRSQSQDIHTTTDKRREPGREMEEELTGETDNWMERRDTRREIRKGKYSL